jgi:hypothetical protein
MASPPARSPDACRILEGDDEHATLAVMFYKHPPGDVGVMVEMAEYQIFLVDYINDNIHNMECIDTLQELHNVLDITPRGQDLRYTQSIVVRLFCDHHNGIWHARETATSEDDDMDRAIPVLVQLEIEWQQQQQQLQEPQLEQ